MSCAYLDHGRCGLAEQLARACLQIPLTCNVTDKTCRQCRSSHPDPDPTPDQPGLQVIGCVTANVPARFRRQWMPHASRLWLGDEPDRRSPVPAAPPKPVCVYRGEDLGQFACGCSGSGTQPLYECRKARNCCDQAQHLERAVEHLRRQHPDDKEARRCRACSSCSDFTPLVPLSLGGP